jgi:hypothetical protein
MKKSKRDIYFDKINEFKARLEKLDNDILQKRLTNSPMLFKEAAIAIRQILKERGVPDK